MITRLHCILADLDAALNALDKLPMPVGSAEDTAYLHLHHARDQLFGLLAEYEESADDQ